MSTKEMQALKRARIDENLRKSLETILQENSQVTFEKDLAKSLATTFSLTKIVEQIDLFPDNTSFRGFIQRLPFENLRLVFSAYYVEEWKERKGFPF